MSKKRKDADSPLLLLLPLLLLALLTAALIGTQVATAKSAPAGVVQAKRIIKPSTNPDAPPPALQLRIGKTPDKAKWATVNPGQYLMCTVGDQWAGKRCSRPGTDTSASLNLSKRHLAMLIIGGLMVLTAAIGLPRGTRRDPA